MTRIKLLNFKVNVIIYITILGFSSKSTRFSSKLLNVPKYNDFYPKLLITNQIYYSYSNSYSNLLKNILINY